MEIRRRLVTLVITAITSAGISALPAAQTVQATAACGDSAVVNRFDGFVTNSPMYGASATITDRPVSLCSNSSGTTSGASAWVMLAGGGANEYAQVGFAKVAGMGSTMRFTEYNDGSSTAPGWNRSWWSGFSSGTTHSYIVSYNFSTGKVSGSADGQTLFTTPWAADTSWQPGWSGQFLGETWDRGDDVPGTSTAKTAFRSVAGKACRGCSYVSQNGMSGSDATFYKMVWVSQTSSFDIYTLR